MRTKPPTLERLADARPAIASRTEAVVGPDERARLLRQLMATEAPAPSVPSRAMRPAVRTLAVTGSLAVVVAAALVVDAVRPIADDPTEAHHKSGGTTRAPEVRTVAYVAARTKSAMTAGADDVVHTRVTMTTKSGPVVTDDIWSRGDGRRARFTSFEDGKPAYDIESTIGAATVEVTVVHHPARSWWTYSRPVEPEHLPEGASAIRAPGGFTSTHIRTLLDAGALTLVGEETLDGRKTVRIAGRQKNLVDASGRVTSLGPPLDVWVDADTYLPVRTSLVDDRGVGVVQDIEWLQPTDDILRHLELTIPSGYAHLPGPPAEPPALGGGQG